MNTEGAQIRKILVLEPNPYHNEVVPGVVKYFQDLNFSVDVMLQETAFQENAFCKYENPPQVITYKNEELKTILSQDYIKTYDYIFITTLEYFFQGYRSSFLAHLGFIPKTKYGFLGIYHNLDCVEEFNDFDAFNEGRIFTLSELNFKNKKTNFLNPHFFGDFEIKTTKNKKTIFVFAGYLRDFENIKSAVKKLFLNGITNFEIRFVGSEKPKYHFWMKKHVKFLKRIHFKEMFDEINKADFYLFHLNPEQEESKILLKKGVSGSKQLILGFLKPSLMDKKFALAYGFNEKNSILYEKDELYKALAYAIKMKQNEYKTIQENLNFLQEKIYNDSLNNLQNVLKGIECEK